MFIGRTDAEVKTPILWPPYAKSWFIGKDPDAEKDWGQEEKRVTEDETDGITDSMDTSLSKLREMAKDREAWHAAVHGVVKSQTWLSDWSDTVLGPDDFEPSTSSLRFNSLLWVYVYQLVFVSPWLPDLWESDFIQFSLMPSLDSRICPKQSS